MYKFRWQRLQFSHDSLRKCMLHVLAEERYDIGSTWLVHELLSISHENHSVINHRRRGARVSISHRRGSLRGNNLACSWCLLAAHSSRSFYLHDRSRKTGLWDCRLRLWQLLQDRMKNNYTFPLSLFSLSLSLPKYINYISNLRVIIIAITIIAITI